MEAPPMLAHARPRPFSFRRALTHAFVLSLIPLGTAFAQSYAQVRVIRDGLEISPLRGTNDVRMRPPKGAVLEVIYIEGDRYAHREDNWYWVMLPKDPWATRPAGWIRGDAVEFLPAPAEAPTALAKSAGAPAAAPARVELRNGTGIATASERVAPEPVLVESTPMTPLVYSDVVVNFEFGRSELTEDAKRTLAAAIGVPKPNARLAVALEGHADWIGTEAYNDRLGLDRAESVKRYLAEQFRIPAGQISVVSYGENDPAASNGTRQGRAQNRRVVIKGGA
jgi:outer membrane protein OmpA-like peptidoglycan-associated protein